MPPNRGEVEIEFLAPRGDAFGERSTADFVGLDDQDLADWGDDDAPRTRWSSVLAAMGVVGLLAGGVVAAEPWSGDDAAAAPTTSVPASAPTTVPRPASVPATEPTLPRGQPTGPAGFVPTEGSRQQVVWAMSFEPGSTIWQAMASAVLVSGDDVTRTSGRWLAVDLAEGGRQGYQRLRPGGVRIAAGDRPALLTISADGVVRIEVRVPEEPESVVVVTGFGLDLAAMVAVAAEVGFVWEGNVRRFDLAALQTDGGALAGLTQVPTDGVVTEPMVQALGDTVAVTQLVDPVDGGWALAALQRIDAAAQRIHDLFVTAPLAPDDLTLEVQRRLDDLARRSVVVELRELVGSGAVVARMPWQGDLDLVVASASGPTAVLDLIGSLRPATAVEWEQLLIDSWAGELEHVDTREPERTVLAVRGTWSAEVVDGTFLISADGSGVYEPFRYGRGPQLVEYRSIDQAFLRITTTFPDEARSVIVAQEGAEPQTARLVERRGTGVLATVVELDPAVPYSVTWFDHEGQPVEGPVDASGAVIP
ncbi:MAG: hypothetical protein KDB40_16885 [Acidimicrobiales bacterium]|nr:hypothetical protein [Acidimicrobiales bacterium]MCB9392423.1 hypothetical protein [Acidimicrobiaceae bacterium]